MSGDGDSEAICTRKFAPRPETSAHLRGLATATYCSALFVGGCCVNIVGPAGPTLAHSVHASIAVIGNVFAAEGAGNTLGSSLIGVLLDRHDGHLLIAILCGLLFFAMGLVPHCTSIIQVVALYVVVGCCLGVICGACNTLVTWAHAGSNVAPWVNLINASFGLGASAAPILFVMIEKHTGNGLVAFSTISAFAVIPAAAAVLLPSPLAPSQKATLATGEAKAARGAGIGQGSSTIAGIDMGSRARYVRYTVLMPLALTLTSVVGAEIAYAGWIYTYAVHRVGMQSTHAAYLNSLYWGVFTLGRLSTIPFAACLSPGALLLPTMFLEVISVSLIWATAGSASALWVGTVGAGLGVCALYSNVLSLLASYDLLTPGTVSAMGMASAAGHMTIPNLVGLVVHRGGFGYDALIYIVTLSNTFGFLLVTAVVIHLRNNFWPSPSSVLGRKLMEPPQVQWPAEHVHFQQDTVDAQTPTSEPVQTCSPRLEELNHWGPAVSLDFVKRPPHAGNRQAVELTPV